MDATSSRLERIGVELDVLPIRGYASKRAYTDAVAEVRRMTRERGMRRNTIRVATFSGPGAEPEIRAVPWPDIPKKAALKSSPSKRGSFGN